MVLGRNPRGDADADESEDETGEASVEEVDDEADEEDQERAEELLLALAAKSDDAHEDHFSQAGFASIEQYAMVQMHDPHRSSQPDTSSKGSS